MKWYFINDDYLNYLKRFESRIPNTNYGSDKLKPFFGSLFEVDNLIYVTQVSHPKERHKLLKNSKDFIKIYNNDNLMAVVNLNYMFPVLKEELIHITYKDIDKFRNFSDNREKSKYINLLKKELKEIKNNNIDLKAKSLYIFKYKFPENEISKRCCDFKELEQLAKLYSNNIQQDIQNKPKLSLKNKLDKNKKLIEDSKNITKNIKSNNRSL